MQLFYSDNKQHILIFGIGVICGCLITCTINTDIPYKIQRKDILCIPPYMKNIKPKTVNSSIQPTLKPVNNNSDIEHWKIYANISSFTNTKQSKFFNRLLKFF